MRERYCPTLRIGGEGEQLSLNAFPIAAYVTNEGDKRFGRQHDLTRPFLLCVRRRSPASNSKKKSCN
jgi:hypothetical protein